MKKILLCFSFFILLSSFSIGQSWLWAKQGGGQGMEDCSWISIDKNDNVYVTGVFSGCNNNGDTTYFGNDTITTQDKDYLVKYDSNGNVKWARTARGTLANPMTWVDGNCVAADTFGNVYEVGVYEDTTYFGTYMLTNTGNFLVKYDAKGNVRWAKDLAGTPNAIVTDKRGDLYITGDYSGTVTFGITTLHTAGAPNIFLAKYDSSGNVKWAVAPIPPSNGFSNAGADLALDDSNNIYITGAFYASYITFGANTLVNNGRCNAFLVKYDSSGHLLWANCPQNGLYCSSNSVAVDKSNNACITGEYVDGNIAIGNYTLQTSQGPIFIAKYDRSGKTLWAKSIESPIAPFGYSEGWSITTNSCNDIYIAGGCGDTVSVGNLSYSVPNTSIDPSFFLKFDSAGTPLTGFVLADGGDDYIGIVLDKSDNWIFGGDFVDTLVLGNYSINPFCSEVSVVAKFTLGGKGSCEKSTANLTQLKVNNEKLIVYPNPITNTTTISIIDILPSTIYNLEIDDVTGRKLKYIEFKGNQYELSVGGLTNGIYLYRVTDESGNLIGNGKFIIQK